jgi:hypothetical protein
VQNTSVSTRELINKEIERLPEPLQREVLHFASFLRSRAEDAPFNGLALSDSVLRRDWDTPEEDAAWQNL